MAAPVIYLSASQADLRSHRKAARAILEAEGLQVVDYEIRDATGWSPVRHAMRTRLRDCHAMVHLAGVSFGAEPNAMPEGAIRRSYAQMEYHLASDLHIPCYSILLAEDFPFDPHAPEDHEAHLLQCQHRAVLAHGMSSMEAVHDPGDLQWSLEALAGRIRMGHATPKKEKQSSWLISVPLFIMVALGLAYVLRDFAPYAIPVQPHEAPEPVETAVPFVIDRAAMERARQMIADIAANAVTAGFSTEQNDPITKVGLAMDEVARQRDLTPLEAQLELQRFANAVDATPYCDVMEKAYAAFAEGRYATAADLASWGPSKTKPDADADTSTGADTDTETTGGTPAPPKEVDPSKALLLKAHFQCLAGQHAAAIASYKSAMQGIDRSQKPQEWSQTALTTAMIMTHVGQWEEASQLLMDLIVHFDTIPNPELRAHARTLRAMASLQLAMRQPGNAEALLMKACNLLETDPDKNRDDLAMTLVSLGEALCFEGKRDGAEDAFRRAVVLQEQQHGPESPEVARVLGSLATMLADSGRQAHAVGLCERALAINEQRFGPTDPRVARDLLRLAAVSSYTYTGYNAREADLCRRALEICQKTFGAKHPATASAMVNLAGALTRQPDKSEAESLAREAWSIDAAALGNEHPTTLWDMKTLARVLKTVGKRDEALNLHHRVLTITEKKFGTENPETARTVAELAMALGENGRYADAEPLFRRALAIDEKQFGRDDFRVFLGVRNLAGVLRDSGNKEQALEQFRRALDIARRNLPPEDPGLCVELANVGSALRSVGRYADAEATFREALAIQEKSLPPGEPAVAETLSDLASVLFLSGRHSDAEPVYRRVLEMLSTASRETKRLHPNLDLARKNYHADLKRMGLTDEEIAKRIEKVEAGEAVKDLTAVGLP